MKYIHLNIIDILSRIEKNFTSSGNLCNRLMSLNYSNTFLLSKRDTRFYQFENLSVSLSLPCSEFSSYKQLPSNYPAISTNLRFVFRNVKFKTSKCHDKARYKIPDDFGIFSKICLQVSLTLSLTK